MMDCESRPLAAPQASTGGSALPHPELRALDFPTPSASRGHPPGSGCEGTAGVRESRARLEEIKLWRPYHEAERDLVSWVAGLKVGEAPSAPPRGCGVGGVRMFLDMTDQTPLEAGWDGKGGGRRREGLAGHALPRRPPPGMGG